MSFESLETKNRRGPEVAESNKESRESKENENNAELKQAAALERADIIVKEVKTSKKQMQNIVMHMQTVLQTIRQLRQQLQLAQIDDDVESVKQDKKRVEGLKLKIKDYVDEIEKMREDLVREQVEELKNGVGVGLSASEVRKRAEILVDELIGKVKE